jgi:hypothetical protein
MIHFGTIVISPDFAAAKVGSVGCQVVNLSVGMEIEALPGILKKRPCLLANKLLAILSIYESRRPKGFFSSTPPPDKLPTDQYHALGMQH